MKNKKNLKQIQIEKAKRLKAALKKKGVSQSELAEKMGVSRQYVCQALCKDGEYSMYKLTEILGHIKMTHAAFFSINIEE